MPPVNGVIINQQVTGNTISATAGWVPSTDQSVDQQWINIIPGVHQLAFPDGQYTEHQIPIAQNVYIFAGLQPGQVYTWRITNHHSTPLPNGEYWDWLGTPWPTFLTIGIAGNPGGGDSSSFNKLLIPLLAGGMLIAGIYVWNRE